MSQVGNLGKTIVFVVSDKKVIAFQNFKQTVSGRWSIHDLIGQKPKPEFNGAGIRKITFEIMLDATLGVKPRTVIERIEKVIENGYAAELVIGGKPVGLSLWRITSMSETWDVIYSGGELAKAKISLSLEEYQ